MNLPRRVEEITTAWLREALRDSAIAPIVGSRILEVIHGTATKIYLELDLDPAAGQGPTKRVWIKTGFEAHSHKIGQEKVYAGEVYYYSKLAGLFDTHSPASHFARTEADTANSLIVMDDLRERGAEFFDPVRGVSVETAQRGLASLARMHASSWLSPVLTQDAWLASGGAWVNSNVLAWMYSDENWAARTATPRYALLPKHLQDRELLYSTHARMATHWREQAFPYCMCHGDAHVGQGYTLPDGSVELLDWQCVLKNSWAYDVANFIVTTLPVADRRAADKDLLEGYLAELAARGVQPPSFEEAWGLFRVFAFKSIGWVLVKTEMQSEENAYAIAERVAAAVIDLDSLSAVRTGM